ncbi:MAG: CHAD domain-containing protein [Gallionella sp.]|nr:CHAD domain-containing protein [Gallionella sp.]
MAIETELKLRISPEYLNTLRRHPLFKTHQMDAPINRRLHNIYFDTPNLQLHARKMALRLRRSHGQWLQTLKGGGSVKAGLHQRHEWEIPVPTAALDFSRLETAVWDEQLPPNIRSALAPVFVTDFYRSSRILDWHGAKIELCIDHGEVKTAEHSFAICEIELELKSGNPQQLFELAIAILEIVPFELELINKAERGYHLMSGHIEQPTKGERLAFVPSNHLPDVLQTIIWSSMLHLQRNMHGALHGDEIEYLHQMRIALRRLRVALHMAKALHPDDTLSSLSQEIATLGAVLGKIREWDVFITELSQASHLNEHPNVQVLLIHCMHRRAACCAALNGRGKARALQNLLLRLAHWMNGAYWLQAAEHAPSSHHFANQYLKRLAKRYQHTAAHLDPHDSASSHPLRIQAKKLRYASEFFATLYNKHDTHAYLTALAEVQDILGQIHDLVVAHHLLADLAADPALSTHQSIITSVNHQLDKKAIHKQKSLRKSLQHLDKQPEFWR